MSLSSDSAESLNRPIQSLPSSAASASFSIFPSSTSSHPICSSTGSYSHVLPASLQSGFNLNSNLVAFSSRMIAAERAMESRMPVDQRLFEDRLAETLAGPEAMKRVQARMADAIEKANRNAASNSSAGAAGVAVDDSSDLLSRPRIAIRTRYFDDELSLIAAENPLAARQLFIIGCGMDSRAFRLAEAADRTVFEVDQPVVMELKEKLLSEMKEPVRATCNRVVVPLDILTAIGQSNENSHQSYFSETLSNSPGFHRDRPSTWLIEGLLFYLSDDQQFRLLRDLTSLSAAGSLITFSHLNDRTLHNATQNSTYSGSLLRMWKSCFSAEFRVQLQLLGWEIIRFHHLGGEKANFGRWKAPVYPIDDNEHGQVLYITAIKRESANAQSAAEAESVANSSQSIESRKRNRDFTAEVEQQKRIIHQSLSQAGAIVASMPMQITSNAALNSSSPPVSSSPSSSLSFLSALTFDFPHFSQLARRLVDSIPISENRDNRVIRVIDSATAFGLQSSVLLQQFPKSLIHLMESQPELLSRAKQIIPAESQLSVSNYSLQQISEISSIQNFLPVDAILCNLSMEEFKENEIFPLAASLIKFGGVFCYNLWPSAFESTRNNFNELRSAAIDAINQAMNELNQPSILVDSLSPSPAIRTRDFLHSAARSAGLSVDFCVLDVDEISLEFIILCEASKPAFLPQITDSELRMKIIQRAAEIGRPIKMKLHTERIRILKPEQ